MFVLTTSGKPGQGTRYEIRFTGELVEETSLASRSLGRHASRMALLADCIEWEYGRSFNELYDVIYIGISVNALHELDDYDGVFSLPREAIRLLEAAGITVGEDFR